MFEAPYTYGLPRAPAELRERWSAERVLDADNIPTNSRARDLLATFFQSPEETFSLQYLSMQFQVDVRHMKQLLDQLVGLNIIEEASTTEYAYRLVQNPWNRTTFERVRQHMNRILSEQ